MWTGTNHSCFFFAFLLFTFFVSLSLCFDVHYNMFQNKSYKKEVQKSYFQFVFTKFLRFNIKKTLCYCTMVKINRKSQQWNNKQLSSCVFIFTLICFAILMFLSIPWTIYEQFVFVQNSAFPFGPFGQISRMSFGQFYLY